MSLSSQCISSAPELSIRHTTFPAATKQVAGLVKGKKTDVLSIAFADKVVITITQEGILAQWVRLILMPGFFKFRLT